MYIGRPFLFFWRVFFLFFLLICRFYGSREGKIALLKVILYMCIAFFLLIFFFFFGNFFIFFTKILSTSFLVLQIIKSENIFLVFSWSNLHAVRNRRR